MDKDNENQETEELQLRRNKMLKSLVIHGTIIITLLALAVIGIVSLAFSEKFREFTIIITFILSSFITYYMIYVKEFQIKDEFKHLPRLIKIVWFPILILNVFHAVNNGFILFLNK